MQNSSTTALTDLILNLISAAADILALFICLSILCIITSRLIQIKHHRGRVTIDVSLILSVHTLCIIIGKSTMQIIHVTIPTLLKDFQIITEFQETNFRRVRAYVLWSMVGVLYWSYVLLAFFRFVRVICPKYLWFHRSSSYLYILIPGQLVCVFISMLPLLFGFNTIHLILNEAYCSIPVEPFYLMIYPSTIFFYTPCIFMSIFYMCIARKIRQSSAIRPYQERSCRDFIVIRRMLLNMVILSIVSVPYFIIYIIDVVLNRFDPLIYRIQWLSSSLGSFLFALTLPLITVQLRDLLKRNKSRSMRNTTGTELKEIK